MKRFALAIQASFLSMAVLFAAACTHEQRTGAQQFPNAPVILISIDTLRADHLPLYGYKGVATPNIDALARDGVTFDNAWSHAPMTLPSHVSMLTGLVPPEHGVRDNVGFVFDSAAHRTLPQFLQARGYSTAAAVSSYVLRAETGLGAAFESYDDSIDPRPNATFREYQRDGHLTEAAAERWIATQSGKPFFFFLHLYEPHVPYQPPEPFRSRYASAPYDGEIATADSIVGQFLDSLKKSGRYDDAIIVLTSDHGEGLGDHGEDQHSILIYQELVRVPLIVKLPKHRSAGTRIAAPVALSDITPTALDLTGTPFTPFPHSRSLFDDARSASRSVYNESYYARFHFGWSELRGLADDRFHLIAAQTRPELYDTRSDRAEKHDVADSERAQLSRLRKDLAGYDSTLPSPGAMDPEALKKIEALGYVGSNAQSVAAGPLPNPRDHIQDFGRIRDALLLVSRGDDARAMQMFEALVRDNPRMSEAWVQLAQLDLRNDRPEDALAAFRQALQRSARMSDEIAIGMAEASLQLRKFDDATHFAEAARAGSPRRATSLAARIALARHDLPAAETAARAAASRADAFPSEVVTLAEVLMQRGDFRGAGAELDRAASLAASRGNESVYRLQFLRGEIAARTDHPADAMRDFEQEIAAFPEDTVAYTRIAVLQFVTGNRPAVEGTLERMFAANPHRNSCLLAASTLESLEDLSGAARWRRRAASVR
jgi:arylsulfatase A-like enzyme/thioredoxin-like negative regulator of GroEL